GRSGGGKGRVPSVVETPAQRGKPRSRTGKPGDTRGNTTPAPSRAGIYGKAPPPHQEQQRRTEGNGGFTRDTPKAENRADCHAGRGPGGDGHLFLSPGGIGRIAQVGNAATANRITAENATSRTATRAR